MRRLRTAFSKRASHPMCTVATAPGSLSGLQQQFPRQIGNRFERGAAIAKILVGIYVGAECLTKKELSDLPSGGGGDAAEHPVCKES
jgi:hypothetical protein